MENGGLILLRKKHKSLKVGAKLSEKFDLDRSMQDFHIDSFHGGHYTVWSTVYSSLHTHKKSGVSLFIQYIFQIELSQKYE